MSTQQQIAVELEVVSDFDPARETAKRVTFLADYLLATGARGYVLGISGGIDSTLAGRLAQLACEQLRSQGHEASFVAIRLPYRQQADETDANLALAFIAPDEAITINIGASVDTLWEELTHAGLDTTGPAADFVRGNMKARMRMVAQYGIAGSRGMLVIGTDHAAEAVTGFYTKFGDGACDLTVLTGLTKRMVRETAAYLGAPTTLVHKVPTADLEDNKPLQADEAALGVSYPDIDAFLEGKPVSPAAQARILKWHSATAHKRALPVTPASWRITGDPESHHGISAHT